jgi:hypothetical protein
MNTLLQPGHHPDADQLSAFAEHALPAHEQQQTLAHLAACPDCRALVYLAQQAEPIESPQAQAVAARRPWFTGWFFGWGLAIPAAALACLILLTLSLRKETTSNPKTGTTITASTKQPSIPASPAKSFVAPAALASAAPKTTLAPRHRRPQPVADDRMAANAVAPPAAIASIPIARQAQLGPQIRQSGEAYLARNSYGGVQGTILDGSGAVIPKAEIIATNTDTGVQLTAQSNGMGSYSIAPLQPGNYNVEVAAKGFQRLLQENVTVNATAVQRYDPKLIAGGENTTVTVTDAPPFLNTADATLGGTIENELYSQLPLSMNGNPRDPTAFQYVMPGVQKNPAANTATASAAASGNSGIYGGTGQANLNENYIGGLPVSNASVQTTNASAAKPVSAAATGFSAGVAAAGPANMKRLATLPSKLPALSVIENAGQTLALDTGGALFRSDDAGVTWHPVADQWQGRALSIRLAQPRSADRQAVAVNTGAAAEAAQQTQTPATPGPAFELTTDSGATYASPDGQTWQRRSEK